MPTTHPAHDPEAVVEDGRRRLALLLDLPEPVTEAVFVAATHDEIYARNLLAAKTAPPLLEHLLAHPPAVRAPSAATLALRAGEALARWGRSGFAVVDDPTLARRTEACMACPHLMEPDDNRVLYRAVSGSARPKVCGACGCAIAKKARRRSEQCPVEDPERPGLSRWGEPRTHDTRQRLDQHEVST